MNTNASINIDHARSVDYESICALLVEFNLPYEDINIDYLNHFLIAQNDEKIIGVVGLEVFDQVALLRSLAVKKNFQRLGLGTMLIDQIERHAADDNIKEIYLLTTTAEKFFQKFGYSFVDRDKVPKEIKSTNEYKGLCPSTAFTMVKQIPTS